MKSYRHKGDLITVVTPAGGMLSGQLYKVGNLVGVAASTTAEGEENELKTTGVFELSKTSAQAWAVGDNLFMNTSTRALTNVSAAGLVLVGVATQVAANPSASGHIRLNGVSAPEAVA